MTKKLEPGAFYGTTEHRYDLNGLTLIETVYPAGLVIPPHEHTNAFFCVTLDGCCTHSCDQRTWTSGPVTLATYPGGLVHANRWHDSGGRVLHVEFSLPWTERLLGRTSVLDRPANYEGGTLVWFGRRLLEECRRQDDVSPMAAEGLVLELLAECSRSGVEIPHTHPPRWLGRVSELLHDRFTENLSLGEVAAEAGVSADHLARSFRKCHACSVGEFVRRLRVEFVCQRLAETDLPLVQVAREAGFTDQSHLTKTFKRHMGVTPAAFRSLHHRRISRTRE